MNYTSGQTAAITAANPEVLVSAAAGSGKTRVVTERVELLSRGADMEEFARSGRRTTDLGRAQDIRRMLLVTFTRAAASEMRSRIVAALNEAARSETDEAAAEHLRAQSEAAAGADITTFHGFCRKVIAENYEAAGVAAGFAVLNEAQGSYLRSTCVREVFDELYEARDEDARRLLAHYGSAGDDADLLALVMAVHAQMMGNADPEGWLKRSLIAGAEDGSPDSAACGERLALLRRWQHQKLIGMVRKMRDLTAEMLAMEDTGDFAAAKTVPSDRQFLSQFETCLSLLEAGEPAALPTGTLVGFKGRGEKTDLMETVPLREKIRELGKEARKLLEAADDEADLQDLMHTQADVCALTRVVKLFEEKYAGRKAAANRLDFADLEHRALRVLKDRGREYAERYSHIFVDEYQDTNPVQEAILAAIHLDADGQPLNSQFLVGDMKQSIYGFRFADPTIFDGKSRRYAQLEAGGEERARLIRMNDNFRSSDAVVRAVNAIMQHLMDDGLGGVDYTAGEQLVCGRKDADGETRLLLADMQAADETEPEVADEAEERPGEEEIHSPSAEMEARLIADQIERLHAEGRDYGDMAALFRSRSSRFWALARELEGRGIPAATQSGFTTVYVEIDVFLNLLRLIVNDRQDVPLLSVMRSFMFGFDEQEMSWIADWEVEGELEEAADSPAQIARRQGIRPPEPPFFMHLEQFRSQAGTAPVAPEDRELHERTAAKVRRFDETLQALRAAGTDMSLDRFAEATADRMHLPSYLLTRPNGAARRHMYEQLLDVIRELKQLHGNSLMRVLNAVDELRSRNKLFSVSDKAVHIPGVVRLMTIHGSKGLEFPVVFLGGLDQRFSSQGYTGRILRSDRYGLTAMYIDPAALERRDTLETQMVKEYLRQQQRSEELRLLYVAMTRARDSLYLCGVVRNREKAQRVWEEVSGNPDSAVSYLEWIMGARLALEPAEQMGLLPEDAAEAAPPAEPAVQFSWEALTEALAAHQGHVPKLDALEPRVRIAAQQGVSKLSEKDFEAKGARGDWQRRQVKPQKTLEADEIAGARRGTLVHRAIRYALTRHLDAEATVAAMAERRLISPAEQESLLEGLDGLRAFLAGDLYRRICASPKVLTEQRFRLLVDASAIDPQAPPDAGKVRLRGMIDLAFLEDDGWVLVDYKTDRSRDVNLIVDRYREQLDHYSRALREITGRPVKERYLYLYEQGESVSVPSGEIS
ncbi:MAG: UvrD-helicase domain-containing protein [Clostridia bacterium]|nr:UvrD-helicase domain-containing protein [Clostridia bacterium]